MLLQTIGASLLQAHHCRLTEPRFRLSQSRLHDVQSRVVAAAQQAVVAWRQQQMQWVEARASPMRQKSELMLQLTQAIAEQNWQRRNQRQLCATPTLQQVPETRNQREKDADTEQRQQWPEQVRKTRQSQRTPIPKKRRR